MKPRTLNILCLFLLVFGVVTVLKGGSVLFTESGRDGAGSYVPLVLWFNFCAGFFYITASLGLFNRQKWGNKMAAAIAASSFLVLVYFLIHILRGNPYELRTLFAMSFRTFVWIGVAWSFSTVRRLQYLN